MIRIKRWLNRLYEKRCSNCPCGWESSGQDDCDYGCYAFKHYEERFCPFAFFPRKLQYLMRRRAWRRDDHAFSDGVCKVLEAYENTGLSPEEIVALKVKAEQVCVWEPYGQADEVDTTCEWNGYWEGRPPKFCPGCGERVAQKGSERA